VTERRDRVRQGADVLKGEPAVAQPGVGRVHDAHPPVTEDDLALAGEHRPDARGCASPPSTYLRRIWYDALVYTPQALGHLVEAVGADRVALGTDYPFDMGVTDPVARATAAALPAADLTAILSTNAATLLGLTSRTT